MKSEQKKVNGLGWLFLIGLLIHVACSLGLSFLETKGIILSVELQLVISELSIIVPALIYVLHNKLSYRNDLGFKKIKVGTIFMSVLLAALVTPLVSLVNLVTQLVVPNTLVQMSDDLLSGSGIIVWFLASVYGPFCEEFFFRSVLFNGFSKYSGLIKGMFVSALLFGLMHLNINQACYAFVLGIVFAIINTASGSVYTSMIMHTVINGWNMMLVMVLGKFSQFADEGINISQAAEEARSSSLMYVMIAIYFVLAIVGVAISIPCVGWLAKHEGQSEKLKGMFKRGGECTGEKTGTRAFFNVPIILSILFALFVMFGLSSLLNILGYSIQ